MSKFKVGDRVAAYMTDLNVSEDPYRMVGTIINISDKGIIKLKADPDEITEAWGFEEWQVHPKQCRKLVKPKRRSLMLKFSTSRGLEVVCRSGEFKNGETIEFVETRKKK